MLSLLTYSVQDGWGGVLSLLTCSALSLLTCSVQDGVVVCRPY